MNNLEYYKIDNLNFVVNTLNDDHSVLRIEYIPKHSKENIILKSMVVRNENIVQAKIAWALEELDQYDYSEIVDDPENYKHMVKAKKQYCFD